MFERYLIREHSPREVAHYLFQVDLRRNH